MQTAVQELKYLFDDILKDRGVSIAWDTYLTQEKQQIIEAAERWKGTDFAEKYYAETYGSKGSDNSPKVQNKDSFGEISDEEIEKFADEELGTIRSDFDFGVIQGMKWYREQLKQKTNG